MDAVQKNGAQAQSGEQFPSKAVEDTPKGERACRILFEHLAEAWFLADAETGNLLDANSAACRLIGRPYEYIRRMHQSELHPPEERDKEGEAFKQRATLSAMPVHNAHVLRSDGRRIPVSITAARFTDPYDGRVRVFGIFRDITQIRKAEAERETIRLRLEAMLQLHQMADRPHREIADFALDRAVAITQSRIGYVATVDESETQFRVDAWSAEVMAQCGMRDQAIVMDVATSGMLGEPVQQRRAVIHNQYDPVAPGAHGLPAGHVGVQRQMAVPIMDGGRIVLLCCVANKATDYDEEDVRELTLLLNGLWDLLSRKRSEEALRERESQFRALYNGMAEAVALNEVVLDERGTPIDYRILDCNPAYETMLGIPRSRAVGSLASALYGVTPAPFLKQYSEVGMGAPPRVMEVYFEPMQRHFHVSVTSPAPRRFAVIATDITQRKRIEAEIAAAREAAEAASRAKDQFMAALSHELRTPLTPVLALLSALDSDSRLPEEVRADMATMRRNIQLEARLIDDLLDLTLIARGKLHLEQETLDLHDTIARALEIVRRDLELKRLEIHTSLVAQARHVKGDPTRLKQVFWNILANAARFTPAGGSITVATRNDESGRIIVKVSDTGVGIDSVFLPRIFDAFEQGPNQEQTARRGLGLGMTIARSIVQAHHGEIAATSDGPGKGACFAVTLPAAAAPARPADGRAPATGTAASAMDAGAAGLSGTARGVRILLVEDHDATLAVLRRLITRMGHEVTTAGSLREAHERAQAGEFDLLMSDIGLPDGSGMDLPKLLGDRCPPRRMAVSGYGMEADLRKSRESGFHIHLVKPVEMKKLKEAIDTLAAK